MAEPQSQVGPSSSDSEGQIVVGAPRKRLLTEQEVSELLRVSREAVLRFKRDHADPIPCYKSGRRYLYDEGEVLRWAKRNADRALRRLRHPV